MALFSFRHSVRTFSDKRTRVERLAVAGQTLAHLRYIARPTAARVVIRERLRGKDDSETAATAEREAASRRGRVCERFIVALPVEATPEQREAIARAYAEALTKGVAGYVLAIHDKAGNDTSNPHFHLVAFDVQQKGTGRGRPRSVLGMARKGAVEEAAALWAETHNRHMSAWGYGPTSRISHLSFAQQEIDRVPQIHEGPGARTLSARGVDPTRKPEWREIDGGHTRAEANAIIRQINNAKEKINEQAHRLGAEHAGNGGQRAQSREPFGTLDLRAGGSPRKPTPPFAGGRGDQEDAGGNQGPGGRVAIAPPWSGNATPDREPARASARIEPPFLAVDRAGRRRRFGVRRVYQELVMWRDTLWARLTRHVEPLAEQRSAPEMEQARSRGQAARSIAERDSR